MNKLFKVYKFDFKAGLKMTFLDEFNVLNLADAYAKDRAQKLCKKNEVPNQTGATIFDSRNKPTNKSALGYWPPSSNIGVIVIPPLERGEYYAM